MEILTRDVLRVVFKFMTFHEARTMYKVSRVFYKAWNTDSLWYLWSLQEFGDVYLELDIADPTTWKAFFKIWWTGKRMAMNMQHVRSPGSFYYRGENRACKFLVGDRFIKMRHGDVVETGAGDQKIWHSEKGFMILKTPMNHNTISIPSEFSYPTFDFDYWQIAIGGRCYSTAISMPPGARKALQFKLDNSGMIEYYVDPRVPGIQFIPMASNYMSIERFDSLIHRHVIYGKENFHLRCVYLLIRRGVQYEISLN